jgi:hypothetical protein
VKGNQILDQLRQNANKTTPPGPTAQVTVTPDPPEPDDSQEASDRCGLESTRYAVQGLVLIETATKTPIGIYYAAIQNSIRWLEPCAIEFVFEDDRGFWCVTIIAGDHPDREKLMQLLLMRLIGQKRELLRANGSFIKEIVITKVEEEPAEQ